MWLFFVLPGMSAVPEPPQRFNLCSYYLDRNLEEGRGHKEERALRRVRR